MEKKKLTEMTLEELWHLFPINLTEHRQCWQEWYLEEEQILVESLPLFERISHIGSTAVSSIWAKPIVDILIEIPQERSFSEYEKPIINNGYTCMSESDDRISFNKGYTEKGFSEQVFHLHLRYSGDNDELYFRDYLIEHPSVAKDYEKLKLELWKKYEYNREAYTNAKSDFIHKYTKIARDKYKNKY